MATPRSKPATGQLTRGSNATALVDSAIASLSSPHTRRAYRKGIDEMFAFAERRAVTPALLQEWRGAMAKTLSSATVNARLTGARFLFEEGRRTGAIGEAQAAALLRVEGMPFLGSRMGNWLTVEQSKRILSVPNRKNLRGRRNYCILAVLLGTALRVSELATLDVETIQQRDGRWVLADLFGKKGRVRTVAIPQWVMDSIKAWRQMTKIESGKLIRQLTLAPEGLSTHAIARIVSRAGEKIGVPNLGPHDLRRTCARLMRKQGVSLEQIKIILGHASIQTTERYLGSIQDLVDAGNDHLGFVM
jgi:integrase